jgi:predicted 2-oxoglutarate/Fe(II)-dependent dioxygenase YbiX
MTDFYDIEKNAKPMAAEHCAAITKRVLQIKSNFLPRPGNRKSFHIRRDIENRFWRKVPNSQEIMDHIRDEMYPYGVKHSGLWFSMISGSKQAPGFHGLHQDQYFDKKLLEQEEPIYLTSTVIYKSDDMVGGQFIIGGDGWTKDPMNASGKNIVDNNMGYRLKVIQNQNVGDSTTWTDTTIHGVAEVTRGERITMMVSKKSKNNG